MRKRRRKFFGPFPTRDSLLRWIGTILMEINEDWVTGNRYLNMAEFLDEQNVETNFGVGSSP